MFVDRKFRIPRIWSNNELKKFAHLFSGNVVNVSGWQDSDKEGKKYCDYFTNASAYYISNWKSKARGWQGYENEFFLDLTKPLPKKFSGKFDAVFNHTTLEHIYDVKTAFSNLCRLSKDVVIVVVPFLQQMHAKYGDYWRFTPLTIKNLFEENKVNLLYLNFNQDKHSSVYIFAIGSRKPQKWKGKIPARFSYKAQRDVLDPYENYVGCRSITNTLGFKIKYALYRLFGGR